MLYILLSTDAVVTAIPGGYYGNSEVGDILIDNVRCTGTEANLLQCLSVGVKNHNCHRKEHAGVRCRGRVVYRVEWAYVCINNNIVYYTDHSHPVITIVYYTDHYTPLL